MKFLITVGLCQCRKVITTFHVLLAMIVTSSLSHSLSCLLPTGTTGNMVTQTVHRSTMGSKGGGGITGILMFVKPE